jgi:EAL domain-containing protein (putative c-di-GMP-specific phosphodiesterase class I)
LGVAQRLQEALANAFHLQGHAFFTSASIGVALAAGGRPGGAAELLRNADSAMYRAKAAGRARTETFDTEMQREDAARFELLAELHGAVGRGELRLYYQPVLRLRDSEAVGAEALLRWQHPTRGLIGPGEFIPLAEDSGLIVPIGAWILHEACAAAVRWPATADGAARKVSVNISARQLRDGDLVATVAEALERSGLAASALCLEVTESLLMVDPDHSEEVLRALKELGVCLSIDDFGTGYSSLARLKRFPLDYLKVDRSFVSGLGADADDDAIVTAIIRLAHTLGLVVVAEGIEEDRHREALERIRCEAGQGWLWCKAVPEAEFLAWLEQHAPVTIEITPPTPIVARPASAPAGGRPGAARVLVVDDDPAHIELVRILLGASGHEVIPVGDPAEFIDTLVRAQPDLVLMDLRMPGAGGLDLVQDMTATGLQPPVLAVSAHPDWIRRPLGGADRFAGVIAKPIDPERFTAQIEAYLATYHGSERGDETWVRSPVPEHAG